MSSTLIQLIYISSAENLMREDELMQILEVSRRKNQARNITGILLYKGGNFLQVLEGEETLVMDLYRSIERDARHYGIMIVAKRKITERDFPTWSMGFVNLNDIDPDSVPGYSDILNNPFDGHTFAQRPSLAYSFVKVFRENMR